MTEPEATHSEAKTGSAPSALPSKSLALLCVMHAIPLGWAALNLPWQRLSWFTLLIGTLAALHLILAGLALGRRARATSIVWQILAAVSLTVLLVMTCVITGSALYLSELYRGIGRAISAALFGIWGLIVLFTVPISTWGLARTRLPRWTWRRAARRAAVGALFVAAAGTIGLGRSARAAALEPAQPETIETALAPVVRNHFARASSRESADDRTLFSAAPVPCAKRLDAGGLTALVTHLAPSGTASSTCLQADTATALAIALERRLADNAAPASPIKIDVVRGLHSLSRSHPLLDALKIRPALDGVCGAGKCFAPWQLVGLDAFTQYRPLDAVRDASFGCSLAELAKWLGSSQPVSEPLQRIETQSFIAHAGELVPLVRLRPKRVDADPEAIAGAVRAAEAHILAAQEEQGGFRYLLDPFGRSEPPNDSVNLPRQAGTTLVLCELGRERRPVRNAIRRALSQLASYERTRGQLSFLSVSKTRAQLGHTALPLVALASCRGNSEHDALIGRLARSMLAMQRDDGSFAPEFLLNAGAPRGEHAPLYAAGQAVLALILVDQLAAAEPSKLLPERAALSAAVRRAMDHYATDYWPSALRSLFFLEENWHCLAARAALTSHRHSEYERFCLDYVAFKSRLILDPSPGVDPEHAGGYSLSNMLPPHSTPTAGFAEALAAAIAVKRASGRDVSSDQALMRRVLQFLMRQQWSDASCFACAPGKEAIGGFSESSSSPLIRIDYVQHAMAALGHGGLALERPAVSEK